jgi:hypothetical protein
MEDAMIAPHQQIRRRTNGTIDMDFYRQRALSERAGFMSDRARLLGRLAAAMAFAPALIVMFLATVGMVHLVRSAATTEAAAPALGQFAESAGTPRAW